MTPEAIPRPARPERLSFRFAREGQRLALVCRTPARGVGCFLVLWLIGWTVGCVALAGKVLSDPNLFMVLFAIPFWASWVFVFCLVLYMFFGRVYLLLDPRGAAFGRRVLVRLGGRFTPLDEIQRFGAYRGPQTEDSHGVQWGVEMRTLGRPLHLALGLPEDERVWLLDQLNDHLASLRGEPAAPPADASRSPREEARSDEELADEEIEERPAKPAQPKRGPRRRYVLDRSDEEVHSPSDCRWRRENAFDDVAFVSRGRFQPAGLGGLLFVNLFWNGIVSVFLCSLFGLAPGDAPPQGAEWWGLFVFLIPFEAIGLVMVVGLLAVLAEPFHVRRWTFGRREVQARQSWFGVGPRRAWAIEGLDRLEIRAGSGIGLRRFTPSSDLTDNAPGSYDVALIGLKNDEVCALRGLTEGEARWIGDVLLRERARWFRGR